MSADLNRLSPDSDTENTEPVSQSSPKLSQEESLLQAASQELDQDEAQQVPAPARISGPGGSAPKKHKKWLIISLAIIVLAGLATAGFLFYKKPVSAPSTNKDSDSSRTEEQANSFVPNNAVYAFRNSVSEPFTIYYRPAIGGERKEVMKLERDEFPHHSDTVRNVVAFIADTNLYVSQDGGQTYKHIYTAEADELINGLKVSNEGDRIAVAQASGTGSETKGTVISLNLSGKDEQTLFQESAAVFLIGWSSKQQKVAYGLGCNACDGGYTAWKLRDVKSDSVKDLIEGFDAKTFGDVAISNDMSRLIYVQSTYDGSIKVDGPLGYYAAAPYKIMTVNLKAGGRATEVAIIGKKQEKNSNGTDRYRNFSLGFLAGTNTAYYAEGKTLTIVDGQESKELYETDKDIMRVHYASDKEFIASTVEDVSSPDFVLGLFEISAQKSTQIFLGDNNTVLFGVSTK